MLSDVGHPFLLGNWLPVCLPMCCRFVFFCVCGVLFFWNKGPLLEEREREGMHFLSA